MLYSLVIIVLFSSINSGCVYKPEVNYYTYEAYYEGWLNMSAIKTEMDNHSIFSYDNYDNLSFRCMYGSGFNNISVADTRCDIRNSNIYPNIVIRLFKADESRVDDLEKYKPLIIGSMDYLIPIIYNATGKNSSELHLQIHDGGPLMYPEWHPE